MSDQLQLDILPKVVHDERYFEFAKPTKPTRIKQINTNSKKSAPQQRSQLVLIPTITIHPNQISYYKQVVWDPCKPQKNEQNPDNSQEYRKHEHLLKSNRSANGQVSSIAKRKIVKAIDYLLLFASDKVVRSVATGRQFSFKIAFITLTLPSKQIHGDNEIKRKCLNSFLIELQKYEGVKNYIWRAEKQKNGSIHFHIIIDKFVHWNQVRNRWNRIVNKLGYVDRYRDNMKMFYKDGFKVRNELLQNWSETNQRKAYNRNLATGFNNPNSTDIHSIQKIHNIKNYFIKYMTKNPGDKAAQNQDENEMEVQKGRIWGSSSNLQNIKGLQLVLDNELETELDAIIDQTNCEIYESTYFSVFYLSFPSLRLSGRENLFKAFTKYLVDEFDFNYQSSIL